MHVLLNFVESHNVKLDEIQQNATSFIDGSRVSVSNENFQCPEMAVIKRIHIKNC